MAASKTASIDQLSSLITKQNGFARSNLFSVVLPRFEQSGQDPRDLNLLCKNVQLPSFNIATIPREVGMSTTEVAHGMIFQPLTMTFRVMNDSGVRKYFETWMNTVIPNWQDPDPTKHYVGYYDDYVRTVEIRQLKKEFNVPLFEKQFNLPLPGFIKNRLTNLGPLNFGTNLIDASIGFDGLEIDLNLAGSNCYVCTLHEAYPEIINYEQLSDDNAGGLSEITVTFRYKNWTGVGLQDDNLISKIEREITNGLHELRDNVEDKIKDKVGKAIGIEFR